MRAKDRQIARRALDQRLDTIRESEVFSRPRKGWIRAIREALGMTASQLGDRLGVSQPRVSKMEQAEASGALTLESLERAAHALDCQLVYALVPRVSLQDQVEERALVKARTAMDFARHTMSLEAQIVTAADEAEQLDAVTRELIDRAGSYLWDDQ